MSDPAQPDRPHPDLQLVVGLGNPGRRYEGTRHNIGFEVLDRFAGGAAFAARPEWKGLHARAGDLHLLKPGTFMNLSGESVVAVARFHWFEPGSILVVCDDSALPVGRLRLRARGSAGGHNGLQSIIDRLGTPEFPRLRIGIGGADPGELSGHVLGRFGPGERETIDGAVRRAVEAVRCVCERGLEAAMNLFNPNPPNEPTAIQ